MKLTKGQFCEAVEIYKSMIDEEHRIQEVLYIGPEWAPGYWVDAYYNLLSELCELPENDYIGTDLDWFCYETDFGRKKDYCRVEVQDCNTNSKKTWTIETPDILYDFLVRND